jgi:hypothetical protein
MIFNIKYEQLCECARRNIAKSIWMFGSCKTGCVFQYSPATSKCVSLHVEATGCFRVYTN